ncbi:plasmid mobilization protein [Chamaesiphon sp. VAR_48_metabat_135_sub]|uniref:plasmid mobilization protein n=1 Tax=Chamaesiphon sp. VAR_48_metabat_135_sub TaxID=2964699 RepID=UPI00286BFAA9|nr:plasmid mobilization relaxosome protein MobC [Chamaesiphon sp. VAR_48_metabat_135_sub]
MKKSEEIDLSKGKTERIEVRMSERELKIIDASAKKMRMNRSEYLRTRGLKRVYKSIQAIPSPDYANLMLNYRELRAQGNNLNQMTKAVHLAKFTGQSIAIDKTVLQAAVEANNRATQAVLGVAG